MKQTINLSTFQDAFKAIRPDNFSYAGLKALFEYLEDFENDTGEEMELDVIGLCCDFTEYASAFEAAEDYGYDPEDDEETDDIINWFSERTTVVDFNGGVIIQDY